jgi:hypothetical protein
MVRMVLSPPPAPLATNAPVIDLRTIVCKVLVCDQACFVVSKMHFYLLPPWLQARRGVVA